MSIKKFKTGLCSEFAIALQEELYKDKKLGLIIGLIPNPNYDEEFDDEKEYIETACHTVLIFSNTHYIDANGISKFNPKNKDFIFDKQPIKIFIKQASIDDIESYFGDIDKNSVLEAKEYIKANKNQYIESKKNTDIEI